MHQKLGLTFKSKRIQCADSKLEKIPFRPRSRNSATGQVIQRHLTSRVARDRMITVISPRQEGGVRDYSQLIAERIGGSLAFFENGECAATSAQAEDVILIQFSGYGYQSRGVPFSLLQWVKKKKKQGVRLGVFFHELFAFGWPWNSSFWLSPVQRHVTAQFAQVADFWITNRRESAKWLLKHGGHKPQAVLPIPSNVGELTNYHENRKRRLVIFGSAALRARTYEQAGDALFDWARKNEVEIHDVGPPMLNARNNSHNIFAHHFLDPITISDLLEHSMFGALTYPISFAAKSGVLAAYCAHGVVPIVYSTRHHRVDGLAPGVNYLSGIQSIDIVSGQTYAIGKAAWDWYQNHKLTEHVKCTREFLYQF